MIIPFNDGSIKYTAIPLKLHYWVAAAIGAAANMIGQDWANAENEDIARDNRIWQTLEAQKSRDWAESMWNKTNEYNDPSAQLQRLRNANINPLSSQISSSSAANVSTPSVPSAPNAIPSQNILNGFGQLGLQMAQIENLNAQSNNLNAQTVGKEIENYITEATKDHRIVALMDEYATKGWQKVQEQNKATASEELWNQIYLGNQLLQKKIDTEDSTSRIAAITAMFHQDEMIAKINELKASTDLKTQEHSIKEMTKWLSQTYGVDPSAGDMYNVASLLLNPTARANLLKNLGLDSLLNFLKF